MIQPNCAVKGCNGKGFVAYGDNWICGNCMVKIINKEKEEKNKQVRELEI